MSLMDILSLRSSSLRASWSGLSCHMTSPLTVRLTKSPPES